MSACHRPAPVFHDRSWPQPGYPPGCGLRPRPQKTMAYRTRGLRVLESFLRALRGSAAELRSARQTKVCPTVRTQLSTTGQWLRKPGATENDDLSYKRWFSVTSIWLLL